jgi:hypothetical protein
MLASYKVTLMLYQHELKIGLLLKPKIFSEDTNAKFVLNNLSNFPDETCDLKTDIPIMPSFCAKNSCNFVFLLQAISCEQYGTHTDTVWATRVV